MPAPEILSAEHYRRQLEAVCNNATVALFIMNEHQLCTYMNPAAEKLTGYTLAEVQGQVLHNVIHHTHPNGDSYPLEECPIARAFPQGNQQQGEETFVHKDGTFYPVAFTASPIREAGVPVGTIIEVRDITEEKAAEHERERFFELSPDLLCIASTDGTFKQINPAFPQTLGWSETELLGRPLIDFIHPGDIATTQAEIESLGQGTRTLHFENRYRCRDGSYKWLEWWALPFLAEKVIYAIAHDVSEQRRQQRTLQLLVDLNQETQSLTDPDEIMSVTARMLGEHLGVNRCAYAEVKDDEDHFQITGDYTRDTFSIVGAYRMADFGDDVLRLMREGEPYVVEDVATDARTQNFLAAYHQTEIGAVICVPLRKAGRFVAAMAVHQKTPRHWPASEVELIRLVVNRCWEVLERASAVRELRESEARLSFMAESMPQKIFTATPQGDVNYFNQQWMEFTGLSFEEIRNWGWTQFIHPEDVEENVRSWQHSIATGEFYEIEHRFRRADGVYRWHLSRAHAMRDDTGQILMWIGSNTDIHEYKMVEEELRESEQRFRVMADTTPVLIWMSGLDKRCYYFNKPWLDFTGRTLEQETGHGWAEGIHPDDLERCLKTYYQSFDAREEFKMEYRLRRFDGTYRWLMDIGTPRFTPSGEFTGYIGSCADITEMKLSQQRQAFLSEATRVIASSLDYEETLASVARMVVPSFADWCTVDLLEDNGSVHRLAVAHVDPTKVEWAQELQERYPQRKNATQGLMHVLSTGVSELYADIPDELIVAAAIDAEHLEMMRQVGFSSAMIVPLIAHGRTLGALSFIMAESGEHYEPEDLDVAEKLANRAALAIDNAKLYRDAQEANRHKDEFLATMSHELRTPLTSILGWIHLLRTGRLDDEHANRAMETIERNAHMQVQLIEDLLDISRIITGKMRIGVAPVQLDEVIKTSIDSVRPAAEAKNIRLQVLLDPQAGPVSGDAARLQQVIWNLLTNAVKFTPKGGRVQVRLERVNSHVEITVADNGQGIEAEFLPHIFDRFRQADQTSTRPHGGLGLGLSIVHQLIELHGGTVRVESGGPGQGATFIVELPLLAAYHTPDHLDRRRPVAQDVADAHEIFECPPQLDHLRVLIVDDESDTRDLLRAILEDCNAEVTTAGSAAEALEIIKQQQPDVLVSDIGMPGEDGYSLIKKVRALNENEGGQIPAVALTAYARVEDRVRALRSGFQVHAPKPVEPIELIAIVANLAGRIEN